MLFSLNQLLLLKFVAYLPGFRGVNTPANLYSLISTIKNVTHVFLLMLKFVILLFDHICMNSFRSFKTA